MIRSFPRIAISALIMLSAPFAYSQEPEGVFSDSSTRELCLELALLTLPKIGEKYGKPSEWLIHAHIFRPAALTCFLTIDNAGYLIVYPHNADEGMIVKYEVDKFSTFETDFE